MDFPRQLNLGSGKDFREDYLNLDVDAAWSPDIVCDLGQPLFEPGPPRFETQRFGTVELVPGSVEGMIAFDVLEHVPDLVTFMGNCKTLLAPGGVFEVKVPYDLSYGAWQDPTHVRAFNERSWLYYTDWSWYLGWTDARFALDALNVDLSPIGQELLRNGVPQASLARTPRAIDAMTVRLKKVELSAADRQVLRTFEDRRAALAARGA